MAVARIFTRRPEAANSLQEELRRQGYTVEVIVPDQPPVRREAEIDLEFLRKAESPTYSDELITEFAPDTNALAAAREPVKLHIVEVPDMVGAPAQAPQPVIAPVVMPAMPPVAMQPEAMPPVELQPGAMHPLAWQDAPLITDVDRTQVEELASQVSAVAGEEARVPLQERALGWVNWFADQVHALIDGSRNLLHVQMQRVTDARHRRQLELQAREVRAQERAAELQAAREAAALRLQQLLRERADAPPAKLASLLSDDASTEEASLEFAGAAFTEVLPELDLEPAVECEAQPAAAPVAVFPALRKFRLKPDYIFSGAVAACALIVIGLVWISVKPKSEQLAKLQEPAISAVAQPGGTAAQPGTPQALRSGRPSAARRRGSAGYSLVAMNQITTRHLGDDVTIRTYPQEMRRFTQAKPAARVNERPDFRRISDLQN